MTRTLPWKRNGNNPTSETTKKSSRSGLSRPHEKEDRVSDEGPGATEASPAARTKKRRMSIPQSNRSASTSPPPEPLQEEFMIDGPHDDDRYRMVEDEFLAIAQQFTAHLHAAEYKRLKAAAKSDNADAIKNISRPVVGRMTDLVRKKQERKTRLQRQKLATRKALANKGHDGDSGSDDDSSPWRASLHGLMESPRKKVATLDGLVATTKSTRAAAGFTSSKPRASTTMYPMPQPTFEKLPRSRPEAQSSQVATSRNTTSNSLRATSVPRSRSNETQQSYPPSKRGQSLHRPLEPTETSHQETPAKATEEGDSSDSSTGDFISRLQKRQAERRGHRKGTDKATKSSNSSDNIVPSFL